MSYGYQISLRIQERIVTSDEIRHKLELRDILAREQMVRLLVEALVDVGFARADQNTLVRDDGQGLLSSVDLATLEVTTSTDHERVIDVEVSRSVRTENNNAAEAGRVLRAEVMADERLAANRDLIQRLEAGECARVEELNRVLERVYSKALKTRAAQLGDVVEMHEGTNADGQYELVIKIEL
ncbi:MAG: hypothetical protein H0U74_19570 [Bradymonadaceae bacterium]|nr:hypothetical protein [Lujinxingiaceae bacterium]